MSEPSALRIISTGATPEEVAAVTAVLQAALDELAADLSPAPTHAVSAWQRGRGAVRSPLQPGPGAWRSFSG